MPTPRWGLFLAVVLLATLALLGLSRASARALSRADGEDRGPDVGDDSEAEPSDDGPGPADVSIRNWCRASTAVSATENDCRRASIPSIGYWEAGSSGAR